MHRQLLQHLLLITENTEVKQDQETTSTGKIKRLVIDVK